MFDESDIATILRTNTAVRQWIMVADTRARRFALVCDVLAIVAMTVMLVVGIVYSVDLSQSQMVLIWVYAIVTAIVAHIAAWACEVWCVETYVITLED